MPTPCYISIEGKTQGNITAGAFHFRFRRQHLRTRSRRRDAGTRVQSPGHRPD